MKKVFKLLFLSLFVIAFVSCNNQDSKQLTISASGSGQITAPVSGFTFVLNPLENQTNTALTLTWNPANYGIPTAITYKVEFAKTGTDFATPFTAGSTSSTTLSWTVGELNGAVTSAGLAPFVEGSLDVRIISTVGSVGSTPQISDVITILITPFTTDLPKISVPGEHQGWDPATAPTLAASAFGKTDYEGYVWLTNAANKGFKFAAPNAQGNFNWDLNWGDDGTFTGILKENSDVNCKVKDPGYYFVKANTDPTILTYSTTAVSWGIIGAATPTGWVSDTDLVYDPATRTLSVDIDLIPGDFKFRGNNKWGQFDLGTIDSDGFLQFGGNLTFSGAAGNYHVVLDLSNPREYTYSLTKN